ncbi:MAG: adenine deaminase [Chloroflexota bacterium]|nr:adenine deaminase [Chloroflexota bacterium]
MQLADRIQIARGEKPADLILRNARLVNVFSGQIELTDIAIGDNLILGVGLDYEAKQAIDLDGSFVAPGLIDAHVHIESSMTTIPWFARAVLPRGTTTVVTDPHEIANVHGMAGIQYMLDAARNTPLSILTNVPSCVPATAMETAGAVLEAPDILPLLENPEVLGLAEVMNYPGVLSGDPAVLAKIEGFGGSVIDGHCPGLLGRNLNAYVAAGIGSDHECTTVEEAALKLSRGMYILIREATNAHNLETLLPLVDERNSRRCCFCTDDRQPTDLLDQGGIDYMVRSAIEYGLNPITAIQMATLNASEWFRLWDRGAVAPGRRADLIVFDDLKAPEARMVFSAGSLVARDGAMVIDQPSTQATSLPRGMAIAWDRVDFSIPATGSHARVIGTIADQLVTEHLIMEIKRDQGYAVADVERDILKIAVIERHHGTGNVGKGFIKNLGLKRGALASSVAHDHHNLVVVGADDTSMMTAARMVAAMGGGLAVAEGEKVVSHLALPVAGLMADQPIELVRQDFDKVLQAAHHLGSTLHDPFMAMSFMALEVIPHLKLTDMGPVDVDTFELVPLFVD